MQEKLIWWVVGIVGGIMLLIVGFVLIKRLVFKKKTISFYTVSAVGVALTTIGILILTFFSRIMRLFGIELPIDTIPITPSDLEGIVQSERDKVKEERINELETKTPDDIIDNELPGTTGDDVRTTIDGGKQRIDDLFDRTRMGKPKRGK